MLRKFCPSFKIKNISELTPEFFELKGIRGLIIDLDNTLVAWGEDKITSEMVEWVQMIKESGIKICILSNALENRVKVIGEKLEVPWVSKATKPRKLPFRKALDILQTKANETAVIGDQLFTDIWGGNRMELYTIWTTPLSVNELLTTKAVRRLERMVIKRFKKKGII